MIVSRAEYLTFLAKASSVTTAEDGFLAMIAPWVERTVKKHVGCTIEQATYTHFLPRSSRATNEDSTVRYYDVRGGRAIAATAAGQREAAHLLTPELPIRSITSIYEDDSAYGGQGSGDFAATTLLTAGTDFFVDYDEDGLCKSGIIRRIGRYWPSRERTVKVAYTAGYTQAELTTGIAADIKLAVLEGIQQVFSKRGEGQGALKAERLGDYSVQYAIEAASKLPCESLRRLQPYVNYDRFL